MPERAKADALVLPSGAAPSPKSRDGHRDSSSWGAKDRARLLARHRAVC